MNGDTPKKRDRVCFFCFYGVYYISSLFLRNPERWLSGRRRRSRKPLTGYSRSGVRIPLSPPFYASGPVDHKKLRSSPVPERSRALPAKSNVENLRPTRARAQPGTAALEALPPPFSLFVILFVGRLCLRSGQITLTRMPQTGYRHVQQASERHAGEQDQRQV